MEISRNYFCIAEHNIEISFNDTRINNMRLIMSLERFRIKEAPQDILFRLSVDDTIKPIREKIEHIGKFETGNGNTIVARLSDGGYQYIIRNLKGGDCCLLQTNHDFSDCRCALNGNFNMRCFGLNNALMLIYSFAGSLKQTIMIHASLVRKDGYGYAFTAKSGTGKSTQVSNWLRYIEGCDLMNDDNPIIRLIDGVPYIYGSPWSGKTPCYRNVKARLGAITRINRAVENRIERLSPVGAFASLLPSCASMKWDKDIFNSVCNTVSSIIECTGIYVLHCLPNAESAIICHKEITKR